MFLEKEPIGKKRTKLKWFVGKKKKEKKLIVKPFHLGNLNNLRHLVLYIDNMLYYNLVLLFVINFKLHSFFNCLFSKKKRKKKLL